MKYKLTFEDGSEGLLHYGVKGMRWDVSKRKRLTNLSEADKTRNLSASGDVRKISKDVKSRLLKSRAAKKGGGGSSSKVVATKSSSRLTGGYAKKMARTQALYNAIKEHNRREAEAKRDLRSPKKKKSSKKLSVKARSNRDYRTHNINKNRSTGLTLKNRRK